MKNPVKKTVGVEVVTFLNNNDLKNLYKTVPKDDASTKVIQIQVNVIRPVKK